MKKAGIIAALVLFALLVNPESNHLFNCSARADQRISIDSSSENAFTGGVGQITGVSGRTERSDDLFGGGSDGGDSDSGGTGGFWLPQPDDNTDSQFVGGGDGSGSEDEPSNDPGDFTGGGGGFSGDFTGGFSDYDRQVMPFTLMGRTNRESIEQHVVLIGLASNLQEDELLLPKLALSPDMKGQEVDLYAALLYQGQVHIAVVDHRGRFRFIPMDLFNGSIPSYGSETLTENTWTCSAFKDLQLAPDYQCSTLNDAIQYDDVVFYYAVALRGGLSSMQGAAFKFVVSASP